jgi:hypothetical protein
MRFVNVSHRVGLGKPARLGSGADKVKDLLLILSGGPTKRFLEIISGWALALSREKLIGW